MSLLGKLCYAALCGISAFLVVLGIGLLIVHFFTDPAGSDYGNTVKGLAAVVGLLVAGYVFFSGMSWPLRRPTV